jgi:hypothetical protein
MITSGSKYSCEQVELDGSMGAGGRLPCWSLDIPAIPLDDLAGVAPYQHHNLYQVHPLCHQCLQRVATISWCPRP